MKRVTYPAVALAVSGLIYQASPLQVSCSATIVGETLRRNAANVDLPSKVDLKREIGARRDDRQP